MILDDVGIFLQTQGIGVLGTTLFKGAIPEDAPLVTIQDALVALIEVPGLPPVHSHTAMEATFEQPVLQIVTRAAPYAYVAARTKAQEAFLALDGLSNTVLGSTQYLWVFALQSPFFLKVDTMNRPLIVFSVRCAKAVT